MLRIHNSLTGRKEPFVPLVPGQVGMYVCGMTVYDHIHVGHARSQLAFDIVRRWLQASGYQVTYVRNITDIDDKIIDRARERGEPYEALTARYIASMDADFAALGIGKPDHEPRATGLPARNHRHDRSSREARLRLRRLERRRVLRCCEVQGLREAFRQEARGPARGRARRSGRGQAGPGGLRPVEAGEGRGASLGFALGRRPAGLAHRVLGHGGRTPRAAVRHSRRRHGPQVSAP